MDAASRGPERDAERPDPASRTATDGPDADHSDEQQDTLSTAAEYGVPEVPPVPEFDVPRLETDLGKPKGDSDNWARSYTAVAGLGMEFAAAIIVPALLGWWLDEKFGTSPVLVIGLTSVGFLAGVMVLVRAGMKSFR